MKLTLRLTWTRLASANRCRKHGLFLCRTSPGKHHFYKGQHRIRLFYNIMLTHDSNIAKDCTFSRLKYLSFIVGANLQRCHVSSNAKLLSNVSLVPGSSQILSRSRGEKSGEGLGSKLRHGPEMVDSVSTNRVHVTY